MSDFQRLAGWKGINNRVNDKAMPKDSLADAINVDPLGGGVLGLRRGYTKRVQAAAGRGCLSVGKMVVFADGTDLVAYDTTSDSYATLAEIAGAGSLVGDVFNDELFMCTATECLRFDGAALRQWGVPTVTRQPIPVVGAGGLRAGPYLVACTFVDARGDEGGTVTPLLVQVPDASSLAITMPTPPPGCKAYLYVGNTNTGTLYLQHMGPTNVVLTSVRDDTQRLEFINVRGPIVAERVLSHNGSLFLVDRNVVWFTLPLRPHLMDMTNSFFQYGAPVTVIAETNGGLYVCADKTYFLPDDNGLRQIILQTEVLPFGAVAGTAVKLKDGKAAWMTQYGLAVGDTQGVVTLPSAADFVPELADQGASGMLETNGNQLVVTTLTARQGENTLAARDYYKVEIILP